MVDDLDRFIKKETNSTMRKLKTGLGYYDTQRPQASEGSVNKFITEQSNMSNIKNPTKKNPTTKFWLRNINKLKSGKPVTWNGRLINPPILDISNLKGLNK